jgi:hypothetical protein
MGNRRWILWQSLIAPSMERFMVAASTDGFEFSGLIVQAHDDVPYVARYAIQYASIPALPIGSPWA